MNNYGLISLTILLISIFSCNLETHQSEQIEKILCINPDTIFTKQFLEKLDTNSISEALAMLNYNITENDKDYKVNLIQKIIYCKNNLIKIDKSNFEIDLYKIPSNQIETELFIKLNNSQLLNKLSDVEFVKIISILQKKPKTKREWYNYLRLIGILAKHYETVHEIEKSISTYLYGIHLVTTSKNPRELSGLNDRLVSALTILLTKEENFKEEKLTDLLTKQFKQSFQGLMREAYYNEELFENDHPNNYFRSLCNAEICAKTKNDSMIISLNWRNYYAMCGDKESYIEYSKKAMGLFPRPSCTMKYFQVLMSILESELPDQDLEYYLAKIGHKEKCSEKIQNFVSFKYYQSLSTNNKKKPRFEKVDNLLSESKIATKMFPGRSTLHLQDYYLNNLVDICRLYDNGERVEDKIKEDIINQFFEVRSRDLLRQSNFSNPFSGVEDGNTRKRINEILLSLNHFKNLVDFDSSIYEELFELYVIRDGGINDQIFRKKRSSLNEITKALEGKLLLNFFRDKEKYIVYKFHEGELQLFSYKTKVIDSLLLNSYQELINKEDKTNISNSLFQEMFKTDLKTDLIVIADGILMNYPMSLIFPDKKNIYQYSNISQLLEQTEIRVSSNEIGLFSYSSDKTLASEKTLLFRELKYGFEECKSISELLKNSDNLISGKKFNSQVILNSKKKMLHLSTHAKSNPTNSFDNFIITRESDQKLYGFELYESNNLPEVVILSACESGIGLHTYGAGVQTLSRAFLDNGSQTVIKTLWKVNEKATAEFMVDMYTKWATGISLYEALELTKESFKYHDKYCAPYYWAGFVLEGNPNVILD